MKLNQGKFLKFLKYQLNNIHMLLIQYEKYQYIYNYIAAIISFLLKKQNQKNLGIIHHLLFSNLNIPHPTMNKNKA